MKKLALLLVGVLGTAFCTFAKSTTEPVDYVSPLVGTQSKHALSTGNTYPAIAMPWGMNFWVAQTGKMGDGWAYTYDADKIRGFKQTHQPSPWINDYGQFAIMPVTGSRIKLRLPNRIIIKYIWPIMMSRLKLLRPAVRRCFVSLFLRVKTLM